jgi:hypothetical protein
LHPSGWSRWSGCAPSSAIKSCDRSSPVRTGSPVATGSQPSGHCSERSLADVSRETSAAAIRRALREAQGSIPKLRLTWPHGSCWLGWREAPARPGSPAIRCRRRLALRQRSMAAGREGWTAGCCGVARCAVRKPHSPETRGRIEKPRLTRASCADSAPDAGSW